jgi:N-dimethylarginine dimethylaminohydrolase
VDTKEAYKQHTTLEKSFHEMITYTIENPHNDLTDIVFIANGGLTIPKIPNTIILPHMKYKHRREELPYLMEIYKDLGLSMIQFPGDSSAPFEGQAELKWFHGGTKAICGYGHRSTKKSFMIIKRLLTNLYKKYGLTAPELLVLPLESAKYYHLDVAMLEFDDAKCIVHKRAFSAASVAAMKEFLGEENVFVIDTKDSFCLNAVVDGPKTLVTHKLTDRPLKSVLEGITGRKIKEVDTTQFERSGGSVRCMVLDVWPKN